MATLKENLSDFSEVLKILGKKFGALSLMDPLAKEMQQRAVEDEQERVKKQIREEMMNSSLNIIYDNNMKKIRYPKYFPGVGITQMVDLSGTESRIFTGNIICEIYKCGNNTNGWCALSNLERMGIDETGRCIYVKSGILEVKEVKEPITITEVDKVVEEIKEELREPVRRKRREL